MTPTDKKKFKDLWQLAYNFGQSKGIWDKQIAEDFAQEYCLSVWQGKHRSLSKQLVNFLRKYYGRTDKYGTESSRLRSKAMRSWYSYDENTLSLDEDL